MSTSGHQAPEGLAALHPTEGDGWCTYFHPWNQIVTWKNVGFPFIWQEQGFVSCWALWMDDLLTPATAAGGESSHQHTRWMFHPTGGSWMNVLESSLPVRTIYVQLSLWMNSTPHPCGGPKDNLPSNVREEPVFISVMAAGWFCEKSGWIGKVEDVKPVF